MQAPSAFGPLTLSSLSGPSSRPIASQCRGRCRRGSWLSFRISWRSEARLAPRPASSPSSRGPRSKRSSSSPRSVTR
eukprot:1616985-Pyramimonas_sp.AAC.1